MFDHLNLFHWIRSSMQSISHFPSDSNHERILTLRVQDGDQRAFAQLAKFYGHRISALAASFHRSDDRRQDLIQEGYIGLYSAAMAYDGVSSSFSTFALLCMRRRMLNWLERLDRAERGSLSLTELSDGDLSRRGCVQAAFEDVVLRESNWEELQSYVKKILTPLEYRVFSLYMKGYKPVEISRKLGVDMKACHNALYRLRVKLRQLRREAFI